MERGEKTRGRQVIRVTDEGEDADTAQRLGSGTVQAGKNATHRLVLQDCKGTRVYAVELKRIEGIGIGKTSIGCKLMLRPGTVAARGTVLLTAENCVLLGGKIDAWHEAWMNGRMARLKKAAGLVNGETATR